MIQSSKDGIATSDKVYLFFAMIIMLCFWGAIPLGIMVDTSLFAIMSCYIIYICWSCLCNKTTKFIRGLISIDLVYKYIAAAIQAAPSVVMDIQNYHYKTVRRRVKTKHGYRTVTRKVRVNTHHASHTFQIFHWVDQSPPA